MTRWLIPFALLMSLTDAVDADEAEDVMAVAESWLAEANAADATAIVPRYHPAETSFGPRGDLLTESIHTMEYTAAVFESGFRTALQWRHAKAQVFGNSAVVTGYLAGTITFPNGNVAADTWRTSLMWVREDSAWKLVHFHASSLLPD